MSDVNDLADAVHGIRLSPTKKLQPDSNASKPPPVKSSSIFLKKNFNSLGQKKKPTVTGSRNFDKANFFNDTPMAVDDQRWGSNLIKKDGDTTPYGLGDSPIKKGNAILNPMANDENNDVRAGIKHIKSGFEKYAKGDSPFKDPYSALNNNTIKRAGANFLDRPDLHRESKELAESIIKSITEYDDEKEIKKLKEEEIDDKDRTVKGLSVNLLDHQVLGLKFLRKREKDKHVHKGGLLCDDMGLGKTVQMIALIVKNKAKKEDLEILDDIEKEEEALEGDVPLRKFKGTLVICPVGLTTQWVQEIKRFAPHLKPHLFHGTNRTKSYKDLMEYDVVVSSYETVRSEHIAQAKSPIFAGYWHRVVLDEAHNIKNKKAKSTIACYHVRSMRRWCLTGTPIQNSVDELQSLLAFLKVSKFSDESGWKSVMSTVLKKGDTGQAFDLLKKELSIVMLRRTKKVLQATNFKLPTKTITRCNIEFSKMERDLYEDLKSHFVAELSSKFKNVSKTGGSLAPAEKGVLYNKISPSKLGRQNSDQTFYMHALVFLLRLRQVCCHWKLLSELNEDDLKEMSSATGKTQRLSDFSPTKSPSKRDMDVNKELDGLTDFMNALTVKETKCEVCLTEKVKEHEKICKGCAEKIEKEKEFESAKVLKLLEILKKDPKRKTIVFSQFRELLVLIGPTLRKHGFNFVMYDGKMSLAQKDAALDKLRNDLDTTVLLCSLKSGAVGLNLTVASQVVIYDPWWNPQIQEQAIDRVYRIGQTKPVDVFEFCVKDTVENGIFALQDAKRELARAVINADGGSNEAMNKLSTSDLMKLFGLFKN